MQPMNAWVQDWVVDTRNHRDGESHEAQTARDAGQITAEGARAFASRGFAGRGCR